MKESNKHIYTWRDVERMCTQLITQIYISKWQPDYIVGITRGGNVPATILSNMTGIRCEAVKVSFRDDDSKTNSRFDVSWVAMDAKLGKHILVVDDINDTGATFEYLSNSWGLNEYDNVRFATLTENLSSSFDRVNYYCHEVNKAKKDVWLVYPWENVGVYDRRN